jgi:tetratricopeptide (TPR) repeat protein
MNLSEDRGVQNVRKSLEYFNKAVELDSGYAVAWAAKARTHADLVGHTDTDQQVNYESSMDAIRRALAIDPNLSEAYRALCQNKNRYEYDFRGAESACKHAVEPDPNSSVAHKTYTNYLYSRGRFDEAIAEIKTAIDLQPVSYRNQQMYALTPYFARRYKEAEDRFKILLELNPNHTFIHGKLILVMQEQGKESKAFEYFVKMLRLDNQPAETIEGFKTVYQKSGWRGVLAERIRIGESLQNTSHFQLACYYAKLGDKKNAFKQLEGAYREHSFQISTLNVEPQLDALREDGRFAVLVQRVEQH